MMNTTTLIAELSSLPRVPESNWNMGMPAIRGTNKFGKPALIPAQHIAVSRDGDSYYAVVRGVDTYAIKDALKNAGARFDVATSEWRLGLVDGSAAEQISKLAAIANIEPQTAIIYGTTDRAEQKAIRSFNRPTLN